MRVGLFTNNYLPFRGGVTTAVETLRQGLELDVFHAQHPFLLGVTARRLARAQNRPLVFTYHTRYEKYAHYVPLPERLVAGAAVRLASRFADSADLVIAPSARIADGLGRGGVRAPIAVVP